MPGQLLLSMPPHTTRHSVHGQRAVERGPRRSGMIVYYDNVRLCRRQHGTANQTPQPRARGQRGLKTALKLIAEGSVHCAEDSCIALKPAAQTGCPPKIMTIIVHGHSQGRGVRLPAIQGRRQAHEHEGKQDSRSCSLLHDPSCAGTVRPRADPSWQWQWQW